MLHLHPDPQCFYLRCVSVALDHLSIRSVTRQVLKTVISFQTFSMGSLTDGYVK